ncbi:MULTISPECIES: hypothetical protein [Acinetobacter]|uniref:Uncharacterized protein n=1 Tax=Acinetobacter haemolyticus TaxID=29430 RepID=A0A1L6KJH6_ACIHA|nr:MULTISPECIES: hypothetical protein [Acinetobacter]APR69247.1 hypothetical protein AHTJS_01800 [Acinetobacter haemolyticus]ATZ66244.1 hypothetical protein BSR56_02010 [Acinetobacter haemolyticus]ENW22439.1 hypothetical protein F926_00458 [Acinetobacter haemolyticus NIPH 261]MBN6532884.1 hypothetical protein [Acinetobacter pittii]MBO3657056.1 hypothetical protein [Acinetobacter haemolyticus]
MKKMIKTAIVTTSILASASVFAQNVGANASGSAQVSVQSNGLIKGVTGAVKNTAQGVGQTAQHVGHAAVNTGVNVTQKTVGTAANVGSSVVHTTGAAVKNGSNYAVNKAVDGKTVATETRAEAKKRYQDRKAESKSIGLNTQTGVHVGNSSVQAQTGLNADRKQAQAGANVGVKVLGVNANVNTNAKVGAN